MCITNRIFIIQLIFICNIFLILPPTCKHGKKCSKIFRFCSVLYVLLATALLVWIKVFNSYSYERMDTIVEVLHRINEAALHISSSIVVMKMAFCKMGLYQTFLCNLWKVNGILVVTWMKSTNLCVTFLTYFSFILASIVKHHFDVCTETGCMMTLQYSLEIFQSIQGSLLITTTICLVQCLKFQYVAIIAKLLKYEKLYKNWASKGGINAELQSGINSKNLEELIGLHEKICNLVDIFNSIFGSNIFLVVLNANFSIFIYAARLISYVLYDEDFQNQNYKIGDMIRRFINVTHLVILPIVLAHECSGVVAKGKELVATCLSISNELSIDPRTYEVELMEESLSVLCYQAEVRKPQFRAGGFFLIDYSMLRMTIGSLTANVVILLQFMQGNDKALGTWKIIAVFNELNPELSKTL